MGGGMPLTGANTPSDLSPQPMPPCELEATGPGHHHPAFSHWQVALGGSRNAKTTAEASAGILGDQRAVQRIPSHFRRPRDNVCELCISLCSYHFLADHFGGQ